LIQGKKDFKYRDFSLSKRSKHKTSMGIKFDRKTFKNKKHSLFERKKKVFSIESEKNLK